MRFKIDWASLIVASKFTVFAFFTLYLREVFPSPRGLIFGGAIDQRVLCVTGLGAYIWRGLFSEFYGIKKSLWTF